MEADLVDFQVTGIELLDDDDSESSESSGLLPSAGNTLPDSGSTESENAENRRTDDSGPQSTGDNQRPTNRQSGPLFVVKLKEKYAKIQDTASTFSYPALAKLAVAIKCVCPILWAVYSAFGLYYHFKDHNSCNYLSYFDALFRGATLAHDNCNVDELFSNIFQEKSKKYNAGGGETGGERQMEGERQAGMEEARGKMERFWAFLKGPILHKISPIGISVGIHIQNTRTNEENKLLGGICFAAYICFLTADFMMWYTK
ncbi:hypothetical protein BZL39_A05230 [Zygosaccharomyces parabailii]|nr:hypothetical protein BZL39_A05230 [Zygosaccharomyces parabailii]CDH12709.1 uncharacterized protein ZBAI_04495 [Zygosaccharomyces bailii ISA1307]